MPAKRKLPLEFLDVDAKENKADPNLPTDPRKAKLEVKCKEKSLEENSKKEALVNEGKSEFTCIFVA